MKKILCFLSVGLLPLISEATFQASGYIKLQYVSGITYQATIVNYTLGAPITSPTDGCSTQADRDTMRIYWGDGTSEVLTRSNGVTDYNGYPGGVTVCSCHKVNLYIGTHTFPGPGTYRIWFDSHNRVDTINNVPNSDNIDIYIYNTLVINPISVSEDSLPVIKNEPICSNTCVGQCYYYNPEASVPVGDSLSYSLGSCLVLGGASVPGYFIPPGVWLSPTGTLEWCTPLTTGLYNFSIRITRYSKFVFGSTVRQIPVDTEEVELQVNVQASSACPAGINEIANNGGYIMYPNPAINSVTITGINETPKLITVYNVVGQTVLSIKESSKQFPLNTSTLSEGMYFIKITEEETGRSYTLKLIKN